MGYGDMNVNTYKPKSKLLTLLFCYFLGYLGVHRFYTGKIWTALIYLFTGGLAGVGVVIDFIRILFNGFNTKSGRPLVNDVPTWLIIVLLLIWLILMVILALSGAFLSVVGGLIGLIFG